ncbi:phage portal protein [Peribacillus butanolivorans]|uniref:phage portal protein n=1 Tax=Peribacillus butanolivorans TaxID=421767 RepID=UPI00369C74C2
MGILDLVKSRNKELEFMFDFDLIQYTSKKIHMKQLAIQTCINMIGRTICQSQFYVKKDKKIVKDEMYYRLNARPNPNMSASQFWQTVVHNLIYDNECLIIQSDTEDLLIADSFTRVEYALVNDSFKDVTVKDFTFSRTFQRTEREGLTIVHRKLRIQRAIIIFSNLIKLFFAKKLFLFVLNNKRNNTTNENMSILIRIIFCPKIIVINPFYFLKFMSVKNHA